MTAQLKTMYKPAYSIFARRPPTQDSNIISQDIKDATSGFASTEIANSYIFVITFIFNGYDRNSWIICRLATEQRRLRTILCKIVSFYPSDRDSFFKLVVQMHGTLNFISLSYLPVMS